MLPSVADAARNNADWCDAMCRAHGGAGTFAADAWSTSPRAPTYYPDGVTLEPTATPESLLARVDAGAGCSIKDSYAKLDLAPAGFHVLFEAEWIGRAADREPAVASWPRITSADALRDWEAAWAHPEPARGLFRSEVLDDPNVVMVGDRTGGAVFYASEHVVGITNRFDRTGDPDAGWRAALHAARTYFPGRAIVGYESGDDLTAARRIGFCALGPLRVWIND